LEALTDAYDLIMLCNQTCLRTEAVVAVMVAMVALTIMLVLQTAMEAMILTVSTFITHQWILLGLIYVPKLEDHF
jgi:hypothetical protein